MIPDYGSGNPMSVLRMFERSGHEAIISADVQDVERADRIVLIGVGAFNQGMEGLNAGGWCEALHTAVLIQHKPIMGICLGMHLMCKSSEEGGVKGLGWIDADVKRFDIPDGKLKVPHMGWNILKVQKDNELFDSNEPEERFYFVHSYHAHCFDESDVLTTTEHGGSFVSSFQRRNIVGVQFHPEKSHRFGVALLRRFAEDF
ncbi:imidazole glycerol phosphate synthase subunit HisH [Litorivicinus sp.]|nr:imidazole glycerol phosphate synthase subunit HisH [Litorivicinus sp.]MDC1239993.1 imidazole glycerol phosphate synthase subunit HisH [Litorivicinus sp.]